MIASWQRRIDRAHELAKADEHGAALLTQYAAILTAQSSCYDALVLRGERLTGSLERDLDEVRVPAGELFGVVAPVAPTQTMRDLPTDLPGMDVLLRTGWHQTDIPFLARLALQPYAETLALLARRPDGRKLQPVPGRATCPFCDGPPQVAVLRSDSTADGAGRALVCATCATTWPVRRILCVACGEEDERRLSYFQTAEFDHVRVDGCENCRQYIKTIDLTRLGLAVPVVDEVASAVLDLWAETNGYTKVTRNLIGL
jgi:FdhE protein